MSDNVVVRKDFDCYTENLLDRVSNYVKLSDSKENNILIGIVEWE